MSDKISKKGRLRPSILKEDSGMGNKDKQHGHQMKKKLTKKEQKAENHAKLIEMRKQKGGGGTITQVPAEQLKKVA
jgi:hypothetical protein